MSVEILMSTMNRSNIHELDLKNKNIEKNVLIINQTKNKVTYEDKAKNIRMLSYDETGTAISKNRALENSTCEICVLSDDDVCYLRDYDKIIENAFQNDTEADIIIFQILTPELKPYKKYSSMEFWHNKTTVTKISMIEIAFRRASLINKNIKFDLDFGINCRYKNGEESILILDCLKQGLKVKYLPIPIVIHPEITSGKVMCENGLFARGALFFRLYGVKSLIVNSLFLIKKYGTIKKNTPIIKAFIAIYKGTLDYIMYKHFLTKRPD